MRIYQEERRIPLNHETIENYFLEEYEYYKNNNSIEFKLYGKKLKSLYKNLNIQVLVTRDCPYNCWFCCEKENIIGSTKECRGNSNMILNVLTVEHICDTLLDNGIIPNVSLTGGEPLCNLRYLDLLVFLLLTYKKNIKFGINTSGPVFDELLNKIPYINLSVHNHFGIKRQEYWKEYDPSKTTIQSILDIQTPDLLEGFNRFSFRFLSRMNSDHNVPNFDERIKGDFVQQKVGDYYFYEERKIDNNLIHYSYSDVVTLNKLNSNEKDNLYTRAIIITPSGEVFSDWSGTRLK
jgi:organic radical activating enzyme